MLARTLAAASAVALLAAVATAPARADTTLVGTTKGPVDVTLTVDDLYVPIEFTIGEAWYPCRRLPGLITPPRMFEGFDVATAEGLDHASSFAERGGGYRYRSTVRITGEPGKGDRWKGSYKRTTVVYRKGRKIDTCVGKSNPWWVGIF